MKFEKESEVEMHKLSWFVSLSMTSDALRVT